MFDRQVTIRSAESGQWRAIMALPHPAIRGSVIGPYVGWSERTTEVVCRRELPVLFVPVILSFRTPFTVDGALHHSFLSGLQREASTVASSGTVTCLQINLTLDAACRCLARPLGDIAEAVVAIEDVFGARGGDLVEQLGNSKGWSQRFDLVDQFLSSRIADGPGLTPDVVHALDTMTKAHGAVGISALAHDVGVSHKTLIRRFRSEIGLPPKLLARLLRLERAVNVLARRRTGLAEVALDAGYADQAHFNRDFRAFSGQTPTEFMAERDAELAAMRSG